MSSRLTATTLRMWVRRAARRRPADAAGSPAHSQPHGHHHAAHEVWAAQCDERIRSGSGGESYTTLAAEALKTTMGGATVLVAPLPAILRMKRSANRPKDQKVLALIEAAIEKGRAGG